MFENSFWIRPATSPLANEYSDYTAFFEIKELRDVTLYISSETDYCAYINGVEAGYGQFGDLLSYKVYDTIDITSLVQIGQNKLDINAFFEYTETARNTNKGLGIIFEIRCAGRPVLCSDKSIQSRINPCYESGPDVLMITGQIGYSYNYDFTKKNIVNKYPFSSSEVIEKKVKLYPRPIKKLTENKNYAKVIETGSFCANGEYNNSADLMQRADIKSVAADILMPYENGLDIKEQNPYLLADLGKECAGVLCFDIESFEDCDMLVGYGEHIADGRVRTYINGRNFVFKFKLKKGRNVFKGHFRRLGGRYLALFAFTDRLKIYDFTVLSTDYPLNEIKKEFADCNDKKIYDVAVNTLKICMHEHYEDTPWREQALYAMDSRNQMLFGYIAFKETEFARASLKLLSENIREDNLFTLTSPKATNIDSITIPCFSLIQFRAMKEYFENSNDISLFREYRDNYKRVLEKFLNLVEDGGLIRELDGIYNWNFYEWNDDLDGNFLTPAKNRYSAPLSAFLIMALDAYVYLNEKLYGTSDDYSDIRNRIISGLENFYDNEKGVYVTYIDAETRKKYHFSELTNSLIISAIGKNERHSHIVELFKNNSFLLPITLSHSIFKYEAMIENGGEDVKAAVLQEVRARWNAMLKRGATSFYEDEKGEEAFNRAGSLSHGWSAVPIYVFNRLLGI